ncbi:MAG: hypothetical protein Q4G16_10250 [Cruoricaptor ignavus]|nr:hypothetical protein [Cruoricaptor ignavus]
MKKLFALFLLSLLALFSCKKDKDTKISQQENPQITVDSTHVSESFSSPENLTPKLQPLNEDSKSGKVLFTQNNMVMIVFDTQSQTGKTVIDGKEYALNQMIFSENNYEIKGNGIKIIAEDGSFQEKTSDCLNGNFDNITIILNEKEINLPNTTVQDCSDSY